MIRVYIESEFARYQKPLYANQTKSEVASVLDQFFVENINEAKIRWLSCILQNKECYVYNQEQQIGANVPDENRAYFNYGA